MDIAQRYQEYADAFELSYDDDDWARLAQYFTESASYDSGDGNAASGRDAVLEKLRNAVDGLDRRMDSREVNFGSPRAEGDTVSVSWTARYTKAGVPDLEFHGSEHARFEGDLIAQLWDELEPGAVEALGTWLQEHGGALYG